MSCCSTQYLGNIIMSHNKKLISCHNPIILPCICRRKKECPLERKCRANYVVYKCIVSAAGFTNKVYLGTAQGEFNKWFYNHNMSFKKDSKKSNTTLAKYIWGLKDKHDVTPAMKCHILKSVAPYSNIKRKCK